MKYRHFIYIPLIAAMSYLGGNIGYHNRDNFPHFTRYVHRKLGTENEFTKKATAVTGGAAVGALTATALMLLMEHYISKNKKQN